MKAQDVNGEIYANYIRTTCGEQEYPKEIAWLFSKLDEVTREGLQNMVVASLPTRSEIFRRAMTELAIDYQKFSASECMRMLGEYERNTRAKFGKDFLHSPTTETAAEILFNSFNWDESPEGYFYWYKVHEILTLTL